MKCARCRGGVRRRARRGERIGGVTGLDGHALLFHDRLRGRIRRRHDARSRRFLSFARGDHGEVHTPPVHPRAAEFRQQCGVDVHDPTVPTLGHIARNELQVTRRARSESTSCASRSATSSAPSAGFAMTAAGTFAARAFMSAPAPARSLATSTISAARASPRAARSSMIACKLFPLPEARTASRTCFWGRRCGHPGWIMWTTSVATPARLPPGAQRARFHPPASHRSARARRAHGNAAPARCRSICCPRRATTPRRSRARGSRARTVRAAVCGSRTAPCTRDDAGSDSARRYTRRAFPGEQVVDAVVARS